jgi:ABC-type amino acid transport substrate-binding protein
MNHGQPISQTKEIEMRMAVMERMALIVGALLFCLVMDQTKAHPDSRETGERPVLLLANESLPPMNFMKHGRPSGIVIDLAEALSKHMHRPVEIRLMDWAEAQQLVLDGRADALLQINPSPERMKFYDFSDPLLTTEFTIFTSVNRLGVTSMHDLRGLKVGVEKQGLPVSLVREDPEIIVEIIPDLIQGFRMLSAGTVDAVIADRWVGAYIVAENDIRGVKLIEHPVSRSQSAIAVKKGGRDLLGDIIGLRKSNGTK